MSQKHGHITSSTSDLCIKAGLMCRELEMKAMAAHQQHSSPRLAPSPSSQAGSAKNNPVAAPLPQEPHLSVAAPPFLGTETAQRVIVAEGDMEDVSLADSPTVSGTGYGRMA